MIKRDNKYYVYDSKTGQLLVITRSKKIANIIYRKANGTTTNRKPS